MSTLTPVQPQSRIHAIDAVRGFALLGIFLVNIQAFGEPFGTYILHEPGRGESVLDAACFYFVKTFCEGKFYPLFSMLFGMGMAIQWQRARDAGRPFTGVGARRMLILVLFGFLHAILLWYGDILFLYGWVGLLMVLLIGARVKTLVIVGVVFLCVSLVFTIGLGLVLGGQEPPPPSMEPVPHFDNPLKTWSEGRMEQGPSTPLWLQTESQAYREGPYFQLFAFRAMSWLMLLLIMAISFGWHVVAMFCFGAALMRSGIFAPEKLRLRRRFLAIALVAGVPLCIAGALIPLMGHAGQVVGSVLMLTGGPLLSLGFLSGIALLVDFGKMKFATRALANVGRMALSNYIFQSLVATTIFYFYGFGLFGQLARVERIGLVLGIYLIQIPLSALWLRSFAYGPLEWVWRSLTYLKAQPMLKRVCA